MNRSAIVIPGPETVIWWGVHVPLLSATFGVVGIFIGHWIAPVIGTPLPLGRQAGVILGGVLVSLGITMATGQKPLVVLVWSIGIGFSGITVFQTMGEQVRLGFKSLGDTVLERLGRGSAPAPPSTPPEGDRP